MSPLTLVSSMDHDRTADRANTLFGDPVLPQPPLLSKEQKKYAQYSQLMKDPPSLAEWLQMGVGMALIIGAAFLIGGMCMGCNLASTLGRKRS